jgi:hypothetical protein
MVYPKRRVNQSSVRRREAVHLRALTNGAPFAPYRPMDSNDGAAKGARVVYP